MSFSRASDIPFQGSTTSPDWPLSQTFLLFSDFCGYKYSLDDSHQTEPLLGFFP